MAVFNDVLLPLGEALASLAAGVARDTERAASDERLPVSWADDKELASSLGALVAAGLVVKESATKLVVVLTVFPSTHSFHFFHISSEARSPLVIRSKVTTRTLGWCCR